ncbi:MAG: hypothetical protein AAGG01_02085 [Planctomycetota bacterium]
MPLPLQLSIPLALVLVPAAGAQVASDNFESGNPNLWGVEFTAPGTQDAMGGNPGGRLEVAVSNTTSMLPAALIVPGNPAHPYRGNFRAMGVSEFRFDRQVELGASNFGTLPFLLLGNDGGTPNSFGDDAWVFVPTGDSFQFGFVPYATISTPIPSTDPVLPAGWDASAFPNSTFSAAPADTIWDAVINDVSYVGIAMNRPMGGGFWFGSHILSLDNFVLEGGGSIGINYCGPAELNGAGQSGEIVALGSAVAAQNDLSMEAIQLPANVFGFFIAGPTQGFTQNPGGSFGNLCLAGSIGRFVGPGQISNSGAGGSIAIDIDLTQIPTPGGFVTLSAGQTWNFQAWYRDSIGGVAGSNFTDAAEVMLL